MAETSKAPQAETTPAPVRKPADVKEAPGFSVKYMDTTVDPHKDFFAYSSGEWVRNNPVPSDRPAWNTIYEVLLWNLKRLRGIAEECANEVRLGTLHMRDGEGSLSPPNGSYRRMVGDFYTSAMDTARIESLKFTPIEDLLHDVSQAKTSQDIANIIPRLALSGINPFFEVGSAPDYKNSTVYALGLNQGGLSMPDRDYYLLDSFAAQRGEFAEHVAKMLTLYGTPADQAHKSAETVLAIEIEMAKASRPRADLRDPEKNYNRVDVAQLDEKYGNLGLANYLKEIGVPQSVQYVIIGQPEFLDSINSQLASRSVEDLKTYLTWKIIHSYAPYLHDAASSENFDFFLHKLEGREEQAPRWQRALRVMDSGIVSSTDQMVSGSIGEALGKVYVEKYFDDASKKAALELVGDIISVFRERLAKLDWMSEDTRRQALDKLSNLTVKVGYPDRFKDYAGLAISESDYVGNIRRSFEFELHHQAGRVGTPVDRNDWDMTPQTVNAYYSPERNEIVFPAGILQPPFFDAKMDVAVNYGAIGVIIGHEITHGFDDEGRKFDTKGNLRDWWTPEDESRFKAKADTVVRAYSAVEALPGFFIRGDMTVGENIADMGGVSIAYEALQRRLARDPSLRVNIDGFTPEQRFFIAYGQVWKSSVTDEMLKKLLLSDFHTPDKYRVILPVVNNPSFYDAFPISPGADGAQKPKEKVGVW